MKPLNPRNNSDDVEKSDDRLFIKMDREPRPVADVFKNPPKFSDVPAPGQEERFALHLPPGQSFQGERIKLAASLGQESVKVGALTVSPLVRTDYKGEKFGQTTVYEVRGMAGKVTCERAEDAAEIALCVSERRAK